MCRERKPEPSDFPAPFPPVTPLPAGGLSQPPTRRAPHLKKWTCSVHMSCSPAAVSRVLASQWLQKSESWFESCLSSSYIGPGGAVVLDPSGLLLNDLSSFTSCSGISYLFKRSAQARTCTIPWGIPLPVRRGTTLPSYNAHRTVLGLPARGSKPQRDLPDMDTNH